MYEKLEIDFAIPEDLEEAIDIYVNVLNTQERPADDCYRSEIMVILNWCYRERLLTDEQLKMLRDYYVHKGIHRKREDERQ